MIIFHPKRKILNHYLVILTLLVPLTLTFNENISYLHPSLLTSSSFCSEDLLQNGQGAYFQHKLTKEIFYTKNGNELTLVSKLNFILFKQISCVQKQKLILLAQNSTIYEFNRTSETLTSFNAPSAKNLNYLSAGTQQKKLVYIKNDSIRIKSFPLSYSSTQISYPMNVTLTSLQCTTFRNKKLDGFCFFIPNDGSKIMYFHHLNPQKVFERNLSGITVLKISEMKERIYIGLKSGEIREYSIRDDGRLFFQRLSKASLGSQIVEMSVNELRNELIFINNAFKIGIISLDSGQYLASTASESSFLSNSSKILLLSRNSFIVFNPLKFSPTICLLNAEQIITNNPQAASQNNLLSRLCQPNFQSYNFQSQECQKCTLNCQLCQQETAQCLNCQAGYFKRDGLCLNCKYASISEESYVLCFQEQQIRILTFSAAITPALAQGIHVIYSLLSGSALLFLFLRFITFWQIVTIYYFLNIDGIPYFLLEVLEQIFLILYGSVFQFFGVDASHINLQVPQKLTNQRMEYAKITTDFLAANFQSIVMYIYSLVLICVFYDGIKKWLQKRGVKIFQSVKMQACLQEFIGIFITLFLPLYYFLNQLHSNNTIGKVNNGLFITFLGIGFLFPFIFTILTMQKVSLMKRIRLMKNSLAKKGLITKTTLIQSQVLSDKRKYHKKANKNKIQLFQFLNQQDTQKFLFCLNCLWSPFLVGFQSPEYFLVFGCAIHSLALWNAFYAKEWKYNMILGKLIFLVYHVLFVLIKYVPKLDFLFSVIALLFIFIGGLHQLLSSIGQKFYFLFLLLKKKGILKSNKVGVDQNEERKSQIIEGQIKEKQLDSKVQIQQVTSSLFQKSSLKNIETKSTANQLSRKIIKKVRVLQGEQSVVKNIFDPNLINLFTSDHQKSVQEIKLELKDTELKKNKKARVKFSNVQNSIMNQDNQYRHSFGKSNKSQAKIQNSMDYSQKQNFKLKNISKSQRKALFDQQFDDYQQKTQNQFGVQDIRNRQQNISNRNFQSGFDKNLSATFSHPSKPNKKKIKLLRVDSLVTKIDQFSNTQPTKKLKSSFSIKQT